METTPAIATPAKVMERLQQTAPAFIADLDFVQEKYIKNYNATHKGQNGELMYHRQAVHMKQLIAASSQLQACDPFSVYACFVTAAVNGYSLDPLDGETYLIPLKGKACLWPQTPAKVRRIIESQQAISFDMAKLVFEGDVFEVENGRVVKHIEKFDSETIKAGYVRVIIDASGADRFFIYRKMDWEAWRKKSQQPNGENWNANGQPNPGFLRTKIISHACGEKCWASGKTDPTVETYAVVIDDPDFDAGKTLPAVASPNGSGHAEPFPTSNGSVSDHAKATIIAATPDPSVHQPSVRVAVEEDEGDY